MPETVTDNVARARFELGASGASGYIDYRRSGSTLFLDHAEVPAALGGKGVGTRLVTGALDLIRSRGERMVPVCPFIKAIIRRYPAYADLKVE
jgi:predicted GNAT family acetyltransferase